MINKNVDPQGWLKVMDTVADLHNHKEYTGKKGYITPII